MSRSSKSVAKSTIARVATLGVSSALSFSAFSIRAADSQSPDFQSALDEMNAIESRIESLLQDQAGRKQEIENVNKDLKMAGELMTSGNKTREQARKTLDHLQVEVSRDLSAMDHGELAGKRQLEEAKDSIQLSAPLLLHATASRGADDPATLTLALIHLRNRQQAHLAVEQVLKIEELRATRISDRERIGALSSRYAAFAGLKVEDLRKRHRELSNQLGGLMTAANSTESSVVQLTERRKSLNNLIVRLSSGAPVPREMAEAAKPVPRVSLPSGVSRAAPPADGLPEVENEEQTKLALGTREGNGAPTVRLDIGPQQAASAEEANRHWRAGACEVHAVAAGKVLFSGPFAGYQHLLVLDHGAGWVSVCGNMTECSLREGDAIAAGQIVGEYRPEQSKKTEPLWIEARQHTKPAPIELMPGAGPGWEEKAFAATVK